VDEGRQDRTEHSSDLAAKQRDGLKSLIKVLLNQAAELGEVAPLLQPGITMLARQLAELLDSAASEDVEARFLLGWLHWHRYMGLPEGQDQDDLDAAIKMFTACFLAGVDLDQLPQPALPVLAEEAAALGDELLRDVVSSGDPQLLSAAVDLWRRLVAASPDDDPARAERLVRLAGLLRFRFDRNEMLGDLDEVIDVLEQAVALLPADHPDRVVPLASLGVSRRMRFYSSGSPEDLDAAVDVGRETVAITPAQDPRYAERLSDLAAAISARADLSGGHNDLDEVISLGRELAAVDPGDLSDWPADVANLAIGLYNRFTSTEAQADLDEAIVMMKKSIAATAAEDDRRPRRQYQLGVFLRTRFTRTAELIDLNEAITVMKAAMATAPSDDPDRAVILSALEAAEQARSEIGRWITTDPSAQRSPQLRSYSSSVLADLDEMISVLRPSVAGMIADRPDLAVLLAHGLRDRFKLTRAQTDLDEAIILLTEVVEAAPADQPDLAEWLSDLGTALRTRYGLTRAQADLDEAVARFKQAVAASADGHPDHARLLSVLGLAVRMRFDQTGNLTDLDEAVQAARDALAATPDGPSRAGRLANLGAALGTRYIQTGQMTDLYEATRAGRESVAATSADDPGRASRLVSLSITLRNLYERTGVLTDLDEAVRACRHAVAAVPEDSPDRAEPLANLGVMLGTRYGRTDDLADLHDGLQAGRDAVAATPEGDQELPQRLSDLGVTLRSLYGRTGSLTELDEALQVSRQAVAATPDSHPGLAQRLSGLAAVLGTRFQRTGDLADLDEAVQISSEAVARTPAGRSVRAERLDTYGNTLTIRYERTGELADLNEAVRVCREAVTLTPSDHPDRAHRLATLANALERRFRRTGDLTDLDEAVQADEEAAASTPDDHPDRAGRLSNLALTLRTRFKQTGDIADLDEGVRLSRESVELTPSDHPELAERLTNLGSALGTRFGVTADPADLDEAVQVGRESVAAVPDDHPDRASLLANLGFSLGSRFIKTDAQPDLDEAVKALVEAVNLDIAPPAVRIRAARAASFLAEASQPGLAARLLEQAVHLLPEVTPRQLQRADQQYALGGLSGLGTDAAALRLSDPATPPGERAASALRLLESGRAILLSQALQVRGDLTDLTRDYPDLAARLIELRDLLDDTSGIRSAEGGGSRGSVAKVTTDRSELVTRLSTVLQEIRSRDGYNSFAQPPSEAELLQQAGSGAVVVLNVSRHRSDALLLTRAGISNLPLPGLAVQTVTSRIVAFHEALHAAAHGRRSPERAAAQAQLNETLRWLWDAVAGPVLEALGHHHALSPSEAVDGSAWPRIWWAPGGLMGLLPLHAAGYHADPSGDPGKRTVLDRVVSSYTPTVAALRHARHADVISQPDFPPAMIVAMPTTPGHGRLDFARDEARLLADRLPNSASLIEPETDVSHATGDDGQILPTRANVLARLPDHPIAHFACHGINDPGDPSNSRLFLHDHQDAPLTVAALAPIFLDNARLAYLSACETAVTTSTQLIDESIHLASAFQLAGYPHVIGTLWTIHSQRAARIADDFYTAFIENYAKTDTLDAAYSLHNVVRSNRDDGLAETPYLWASHVHIGA